ncbi:MAG: sodium:solute symporter, partial [Eudoraea sp.]
TLIDFYKKTRPWGFWKPIQEKVLEENPDFKKNTGFKKDMFTVFIGTAAQTLLVIIPLYLILREYTSLCISLGLFAVCGLLLKKFWWDTLDEQQ